MKKDLGVCALFPWSDLYELFNEKPTNFTGKGGYKKFNNKCFVLLNGAVKTKLILPKPKNEETINYIKNNIEVEEKFNGTLVGSGNYIISIVYEI